MNLNNWDPLKADLSSELVSATIKRHIKNILKSYTGWFDPFSELIQNALDAVEHRIESEEEFTPTLWIDIDLMENSISITDNGIGFSEDQFMYFLAPDVSFKTDENRGNKGVGATYLGYGFNFLQIGTKTPDFEFIGTMKDGRDWVEDEGGVKTRPKVIRDTEPMHEAFNDIDRGSTFTLRLVGKYVRPKKLNWIGATNADQWGAILRIKTPLGGVYFNRDSYPPIECHLRVTNEAGEVTSKQLQNCEYLYPHKVVSACVNLDEIRDAQYSLWKKGKDVSKLPDKFFKLNGLYKYWPVEDFLSKDGEFVERLNDAQKELIKTFEVSCYGFFCYTTDIWDHFNDEILRIRKNERILRGGLQLATNSMPQGELIPIPLTRNVYYQSVSHVVTHFVQADPDLGRKGFQPELEDLAKHLGGLIVNSFLNWRNHLKKETGAPPDIQEKKAIHDWIRDLENYEEDHPLIICRKDVFLPTKEPSISAKPLNEQDVIALFNQLLAGGVIRGIRLMATSTHKQYDGVFRLCLKEPFENYVFDKERNPLGLDEDSVTDEYLSEPRILEYKYSFNALVEEIEKETKNERDISLVIAWEMGDKWRTRYEVTPLLHFDNIHHRVFHGATHLLKNSLTGDSVFPAIILSELIEYLNDPDSVQEYQERTYLEI